LPLQYPSRHNSAIPDPRIAGWKQLTDSRGYHEGAVKAGGESRMQEAHEKRMAYHLDPESCADTGTRVSGAFTGTHADPAVSQREARIPAKMLVFMKQIGLGRRLSVWGASFRFEGSRVKKEKPAASILLATSYGRFDARPKAICVKRSQFAGPSRRQCIRKDAAR